MPKFAPILCALAMCTFFRGAYASTPGPSAASYSVVTDTLDAGGGSTSSNSYSAIGSVGGIFGESSSTSYGARHGYIAQLASGVITSPFSATGTVGLSFSYQISATGSPTSFNASGLPAGLSVNTATGLISGTPSAAGVFMASIGAQTSDGEASAALTITISSSAPVITSVLSATGVVGQNFQYDIVAVGAPPITYSAAPLPQGLSLTGSTISGIPVTVATTPVMLTASNASGSDTKTLSIIINPSGSALIVLPPQGQATAGGVGVPYSFTITASGDAPIVFSASNLPPGLALNGNVISGTPTASGTFDVAIVSTNSIGSDMKTLTIVIGATGAPLVSSALTADATAGVLFNYPIQVNVTSSSQASFSTSTLPGGLALVGNTITGTPTVFGIFNITISASNAIGSDSKTLVLSIRPTNYVPPVVTEIAISRNPVRTGVPVTFTATAVPAPGLTVTDVRFFFIFNGAADGPVLTSPTGSVERTFADEGDHIVQAAANDGFGFGVKSQDFNVLPLLPNPTGAGSNIAAGIAVGPADLQIEIPAAEAGVLDIDIVSNGARAAGDTFETLLRGINRNVSGRGQKRADKFTRRGIYPLEVVRRDVNGTETGRAVRMLPVSDAETTGATAVTIPAVRTVLGPKPRLSGKFNFGKSRGDTFSLSNSVELPGGLDLTQPQQVSVGVGNVVEDVTFAVKGTSKPKVTSKATGVKFTKVQIKWPRAAVTENGTMAAIGLQLKSANLAEDGFKFEGITNTVTENVPVNLSIQVAVIISGVTYYSQLPATYTLKKGKGQLKVR